MRPQALWSAALAAALLAGVAGCGGGGAATGRASGAEDTTRVLLGPDDVARVAPADLTVSVPVSGTLEPAVDVRMASPLAETLDQVLVKEGERVRRGQVLARFRSVALEPAAASAEAELSVATADLERMQNLLKEGAVSPRDVDKAQAAFKAAQASAAAATKRLDEATVRAPIGGVIAERMVQSGDRVGDGDPLFRLVNVSELEFEATVPSEYAARLRPGLPVELTVTGAGNTPVEGQVARVNATADPATRQVRVYVRVPNADGRLVGDLFATGRIVLDRAKQVLSIPGAGVRVDSVGKSFVWIVADGHAQDRPVDVGVRDEQQDRVEVRQGLEAGELAIVGPIEGLAPGQPVQAPGGEK